MPNERRAVSGPENRSVFKRLQRITSGGRRFIPEVDGLRFVAIMAVVSFHLSGYTLQKHMAGATIHWYEQGVVSVLGTGSYGVHLFFVLSGFLLAMPFAKWRLGLGPKPSLRAYYLRRLTRLEPPYIVSMLLMFVAGMVAFGVTQGLSRWPNLLASLLYQHSLLYGRQSLINGVAWTLEIEVQFYVLAPFLTAVFAIGPARTRRAALVAMMIAITCLRKAFLGSFSPAVVGGPLGLIWYIEFFLAGFLLADLFLTDWKGAPEHSFKWDFVSLLAWPILVALIISAAYPVLIPFAVFLACAAAFRGRVSSWIYSRPILTVTGGMCYSMYLLHVPVISLAGSLAGRLSFGTAFMSRFATDVVIVLPAIMMVTCAAFVLVERPCMDPMWPQKLAGRMSSLFERSIPEPAPRRR